MAVVEPGTNVILHGRLYPSRTTALTKMFLRELEEKHAIDDAESFVAEAHWLHASLFEFGMHFGHETVDERNHVERVF